MLSVHSVGTGVDRAQGDWGARAIAAQADTSSTHDLCLQTLTELLGPGSWVQGKTKQMVRGRQAVNNHTDL